MAGFLDRARKKAESERRQMIVEICFNYPQYKLEEFGKGGEHEDMPLGDMLLLLNFARMHYYEDKLDTLFAMTGAQSKKGFKTVKENWKKKVTKLGRAI